jgi:GTP 3',8-cyclase
MSPTESKPGRIIGGGKLAAHPEQFDRWLKGLRQGPLVVEVAPTRGCNHDCMHCGFQQFSRFETDKNYLDDTAFRQFIDDFADLGGVEIYFAGNGEPLLNPLLDNWMAYIGSKGLDCTLSTNGVLFGSARHAGILPSARWIRFSVNGGDAETYARVHRCSEGDFEILAGNLARAVEYRNSHGLDCRLVIQSLIYEPNWRSLEKLVLWHEEAGTDMLILRNVAFRHKQDPLPGADMTAALMEAEKAPNVQVRWETYGVNMPRLDWSRCFGINFRTNMDDRGNLFACFCSDCRYGNIHESRFRDIWFSERKIQLFREIESGLHIPECRRWCPAGFDNVYIENHVGSDYGR